MILPLYYISIHVQNVCNKMVQTFNVLLLFNFDSDYINIQQHLTFLIIEKTQQVFKKFNASNVLNNY